MVDRVRVVMLTMTVVAASVAAQPSVTVYTARGEWEAAIGGRTVIEEDFEAFSADEDFRPEPMSVAIANGTLRQAGGEDAGFRNKVDVPPLEFGDHGGTAHASCHIDHADFKSDDFIMVEIDFTEPVAGWGASFFGATDGEWVRIDVSFGGHAEIIGPVPTNGFFGFVVDDGDRSERIWLRSYGFLDGPEGESFGMDDIVMVTDPVPVELQSWEVD